MKRKLSEEEKRERKLASQRKYRDSHREEIKNKTKEYKHKNIEKIKQNNKEYKKNNKDKIKKYYQDNKEYIAKRSKKYRDSNKEKIKLHSSIYYQNSKINIIEKSKEYYYVNRDKINEKNKLFYHKNKEKINEKRRLSKNEKTRKAYYEYMKKYNQNILVKLRRSCSNMVRKMINKRKCSILKYLSYTIEQLRQHLESQFEFWMNWNNWGVYRASEWNDNDLLTWKWQIDHIIPHSTFKYTSMEDEEFKKCWALENLRPLSAKINLLDGTSRIRHK